jgi:NAD(P)-dependent dehydrogenase (short-subunit alcohol dehydrogenase family)
MARVFVTGSADGLGKMAAELLIEQGHKVVLQARTTARAEETRKKVAGADDIVVGDLSSIAETKSVADQMNRLGRFDAVIHNAGIGYREPKLVKTTDGLPQLFAVNTLAPYILTALITMPKRLVYLSSGMHYGAGSHLDDILWEKRRWNGSQAYAETKFQDVLLAFAVARLFPEVKSNSLEPGWVPTRWAAPARRTISTRRTGPWCGWRRATPGPPRFLDDTSFTNSFGIRTRLRRISNDRICCSTCAARFQAQL